MTIEDIVLDRDKRGIAALRPHLPADYCDQAARVVLDNPGTAIIVTGFYIITAGATETDGPPGAVVIGNALQSIGYEVVYVTDRYSLKVMEGTAGPDSSVVEFPIAGEEESRSFAKELLSEIAPSVIIGIERCGLTSEGLYRNMRGVDISEYNAKADYLFESGIPSVGIGDGGNEIGMGNLAAEIAVAYMGAIAPEAEKAVEQIREDVPGAGLLSITSPDRLHSEWIATRQARVAGDSLASAHIECLLGHGRLVAER